MKKIVLTIGILFSGWFSAQSKFLTPEYWKAQPNVETVKADIAAGNDPSESNAGQFDVVTIAINNDAPLETIIYLMSQPGNATNKITHDGRIYLHWAAMRNNAPLVEYLLKGGSDMFAEDTGGRTPFVFGLIGGMQKETIEKFINAGYPLHQKDENGANLALQASLRDSEDLAITNYFISKGINVKETDKYGRTIVDYAAKAGNEALLSKLISAGYAYTDQALMFAAEGTRKTNELPIFVFLVEKLNIKANTVSPQGKNALHYLAGKDGSEASVKYLVEKGADVAKVDKEGATPLFYAARNKKSDNLKLILGQAKTAQTLVNTGNGQGQTPLMAAVQYGSLDSMGLLLDKGAKLDARNIKGANLLYYIFEGYNPRNPNAIKDITAKLALLKEKGFDFAQKDGNGNTILHLAAAKDIPALVELAYGYNADINAKNNEGETALIINAMVAKNDKILSQLVQWGADKTIKNSFDETAFQIATDNELLIKNKTDLNFLK